MPSLKNAGSFGQQLLDQFIAEGWGSLSKRDLELLIFALLEKDGTLNRAASNYDLARLLRVTESKVSALRKDSYARWRHLVAEEHEVVVKRVLGAALRTSQLEQTLKYASERKMQEGFVPLLVEHPDDRAEVLHAVKSAGAIPVLERNREVILVHYETLLDIAERLGVIETDRVKIHRELRKLLAKRETLKDFLTTPVREITPAAARAALNDAGMSILEGGLRALLPGLLKIAITCIR